MLIRWAGAAMLMAACGGVGAAHSRELRNRVKTLHELLKRLERMKTEVCCLLTPLPEVLGFLCDTAIEECEIKECSLSEIWCREVATLNLPAPEASVLRELGLALSRGDEPERAFRAAKERLQSLLKEAENDAEKKCRLSSALGICAGILLVLVLI